MKIKAFLLTFIVIIFVFCNVSCSNDRDYDETEVISYAIELIKKSEKVNDIFYGTGIQYSQLDAVLDNTYIEADTLSLNYYGVSTTADIKELARECFSDELSNIMINTVISSVKDSDGTVLSYARYTPKIDTSDDTEIGVMVNKNFKPFLTDKIEYDYNSIRISDVEGEIIYVEITVKVTNSDEKEQIKDIKIALVEESNGFRLDSPTYARYVDEEYYKDLQSKK